MPSHVGQRHKTWILLQALNKVPQDFDETPAVWETQYTVRATIEPSGSGEPVEGQKIQNQITHDVEMRWMPGVRDDWRIVIEDATKATDAEKRVLHIQSVVDWKNQHKYLDISCIEQT